MKSSGAESCSGEDLQIGSEENPFGEEGVSKLFGTTVVCAGGREDLIRFFFYLFRKISFEDIAEKAVGFCLRFSEYLNWLGTLK